MDRVIMSVGYDPKGIPPYFVKVFAGTEQERVYHLNEDGMRSFWADNDDVWCFICDKVSENET